MSRATLEQDKKKTRAKDGPGAETDRKEREEYGEETDELEDDVPQGGRMSLLAHLNELRRRLTICAVCFLVGVALCLSQAEWFTNLLLSRGENFSFVYIAPAELMMTYVRISLVGGVVIIIPVIIYHIWRFLQPGLKRAEQMGFNLIITVGLLLFCLGGPVRLHHRAAHPAGLFCTAEYLRDCDCHGVSAGVCQLCHFHHADLRRDLRDPHCAGGPHRRGAGQAQDAAEEL